MENSVQPVSADPEVDLEVVERSKKIVRQVSHPRALHVIPVYLRFRLITTSLMLISKPTLI
jgi:hypothetical protein